MSTLAFSDTFVRANSSPGSPGNSWNDLSGADWFISSNTLVNINTTFGETTFPHAITRPASEVTQNGGKDQCLLCYVRGSNAAPAQPNTDYIPIIRVQNSNTFYYLSVDFNGGIIRIEKMDAGVRTDFAKTSTFSVTPGTSNYIIMFAAQSTDASHTTVTAKIWNASNVSAPLASIQLVGDTTTSLQAAGVLGMNHAYTGTFYRVEEWNYDGTDPTLVTSGVFMPAPIVASVTQTSISLTAASATTGTAPYTYQWYSDPAPNFTPGAGNLLAGLTTLSVTHSGLAPATLHFYKVVATDSLSTQGTSNSVGGYTVLSPTISIGGVGDSIMANIPHDTDNDLGLGDIHLCLYDPFKVACRYLEKTAPGLRNVNAYNQAVPGLTSTQWAPAVLNLPPASYTLVAGANTNVGTGTLKTALVAFAAASPPIKYVLIMLGANDSTPSNQTSFGAYQANMQSLCNALIGNGYTPVVNYPTWIQDQSDGSHDQGSMVRILQYVTAVNNIVNGTTILQGDTLAPYYGANNVNLFEGSTPLTSPNNGVHPNQDGGYNWGEFWGRALDLILNPKTPPPVQPVGGLTPRKTWHLRANENLNRWPRRVQDRMS